MRRRKTPALAVAALAGACGTEPPVPASIEISPLATTLLWFDETVELTASVRDQHGRTMPGVAVTWTSGDESVVTVDAAGLVTVVGEGVAPVRAAVEGLEASSTVGVDLQRGALVRIYEALGGPGWLRIRNWGTDEPLDQWWGVRTDTSGNVVGLDLSSNDLAGAIPPEIGNLENLRTVHLSSNDLTGPVPPEIGNLRSLQRLDLSSNDLAGAIPPELGSLDGLDTLDLSSNELIAVPPELGNLQRLRRLDLSSNELTGPVLPELGALTRLAYLAIDNNPLSGRLPRELIGIPLRRFDWYETDLCSPPDAEFQEWLVSIQNRGNGPCDS
ncbi:MAG: Ig-like domain-containing protein [Gemmatimonadota bacterium]|nr:Ig-like domain-containing protein [Gemmatimonadota bacterium]